MKKRIFTGSGVAVVTPMNQDGGVHLPKLCQLINWQIQAGTSAIIICGTTGESPTLTGLEWEQAVSTAVEVSAGRVAVVAGTGGNDTLTCIQRTKRAELLGANGALVVTPYYNKTSQEGLVTHFQQIAESSDLPIILYNVPSRTALNIQPETYCRLSEHPNIVATKEANGNLSEIAQTMALCGEDLPVYSGNDDQILPIMSMGGIGVISVWANIMPKEVAKLCQCCLEGNFTEARRLQLDHLPLINSLFADVNPLPVKEALNLMGYEVGNCRPPLYDLSPSARKELAKQLLLYGLGR